MVNEWMWGIAHSAYRAFKFMEAGENKVNAIFIGLMVIFAVAWIRRMIEFDKEAEANGTIP